MKVDERGLKWINLLKVDSGKLLKNMTPNQTSTRCMTPEELVNMKRLQLDLLTGMITSPGKVSSLSQKINI